MTLKNLTVAANTGMLIVLAAIVAAWSLLNGAQKELQDKYRVRYESYLLADELRQSSDDLTRLARTYVVTGEQRYEDQYLAILDIRNGKKPRPQAYHRIYWDFVAAGNPKPRPDTEAVPLQSLMKQAGFTDAEFAKLSQAQANSDGLVKLEVIAMNAVKGLFDDGKGNFNVKKDPDFELARKLVHSPEYHGFKAQIMAPIDEFFVLLDNRTSGAIRQAEKTVDRDNAIFIGLLIVLVMSMVGYAVLFYTGAIRPVEALRTAMQKLAKNETDLHIPALSSRNEIGEMARTVETFRNNAIEKAQLESQTRDQQHKAAEIAAQQYAREQQAREEVAAFCNKMARGDLSGRIEEAGKDGFFLVVSQQLNQLTSSLQSVTGKLAASMSSLAQGDLTVQVAGDYQGVFGELRDSMNRMIEQLKGFAARLNESSAAVRDASAEISSGSQDLASRTESQAASIEETAASMHEITTTVKQNADNAQAANQLAVAARDTAEKGGSVVADAVTAVTQIEESARKIADIVGLIDEIAFQTNLLALNASVEAARAGEAGKGFAVVAQEVRALAQRSANASKDIKALISESNTQVKTGASLVNQTGSSLTEIVTAIKKVSDIVAEIAAASREQASGLDQVNTAVGSMDEMTQRNGALVEETSASAQALSIQAGQLAQLVGFFKTGKGTAAPAYAPVDAVATATTAPQPKRTAATEKQAKSAPKPASTAPVPLKQIATPKPALASSADGSGEDWQEF